MLTGFVLSVAEVLRGESLPIRVLWVRRKSGVQVCAKHMHEDLEAQSKYKAKIYSNTDVKDYPDCHCQVRTGGN